MFEVVYKAESYIVEAVGPDDEAAKLGLQWLIQFALKRRSSAGLFVATLGQAAHFARFLGRAGTEALRKRRYLDIHGVRVHLLTERGLPYEFEGPILCMWVDDKQLEPIEGLGAPALCAIPWQRTDLENWKLARTPTDLRTGVTSKGPTAPPLLAAVLRSLTTAVNVGTGLAHPSDKAAAIDLFQTLKSAGEPFTGQAVRALASQLGWQAEDARELGELADKIAEGRKVRSPEPQGTRWGAPALARWRSSNEA